MYLSVIAILMGAKNPIEIYQWMKNNSKRKEIKKLLGVEFFKASGKLRVYNFFEIFSNEILAFQELTGELDETFTYGFEALNTQKKL